MKIQSNFTTVQVSPAGSARRARADLVIAANDLPESAIFTQRGMLCLYGTDAALIAEALEIRGSVFTVVVCPKAPVLDKLVAKMVKAGRQIVYVDSASVENDVLYSQGYVGDTTLWMQSGDDDVVAALTPPKKVRGRGKAKAKARAHDADGTFKADDPATPDVNEAYEATEQPG